MEVMGLIDYKLDFISFRNLMYNFQKDWIPIMFKETSLILKKMSEVD